MYTQDGSHYLIHTDQLHRLVCACCFKSFIMQFMTV